jgi:hypothetical protein
MAEKIMADSGKYRYVAGVSAHQGGYLNFAHNYARFAFDTIEEARKDNLIADLERRYAAEFERRNGR